MKSALNCPTTRNSGREGWSEEEGEEACDADGGADGGAMIAEARAGRAASAGRSLQSRAGTGAGGGRSIAGAGASSGRGLSAASSVSRRDRWMRENAADSSASFTCALVG